MDAECRDQHGFNLAGAHSSEKQAADVAIRLGQPRIQLRLPRGGSQDPVGSQTVRGVRDFFEERACH